MKKKRRKYPFCIIMACSVVIFWGTITTMGYTLGSAGTLVKREEQTEVLAGMQNIAAETEILDERKEAEHMLPPNTEEGNRLNTESEQIMPEKESEREFVQVDMSYLDGALFIGDSRTSTLYEYAGWDETTFFVEYGLTIWDVMDSLVAQDQNSGEKISVRDALKQQKYDKIYIMLGINELGRGTADTFYEQYKAVVDEIRALQPDAVLFVESIMHVTDKKDSEGTYINNTEIDARNEKIKTLADNKSIFWLDENETFDLEGTSKLNPEFTSDGVHLKAKYISVWRDFLLLHGIE